MRGLAVLLGAVLLSACGLGSGPAGIGGGGLEMSDSCDARSQRGLIGQPIRDRAAVAAAAPKVRFIGPGDAVTMDNQPERLNIETDASGVVTRVYCG